MAFISDTSGYEVTRVSRAVGCPRLALELVCSWSPSVESSGGRFDTYPLSTYTLTLLCCPGPVTDVPISDLVLFRP